jgi:hypothetical protein
VVGTGGAVGGGGRVGTGVDGRGVGVAMGVLVGTAELDGEAATIDGVAPRVAAAGRVADEATVAPDRPATGVSEGGVVAAAPRVATPVAPGEAATAAVVVRDAVAAAFALTLGLGPGAGAVARSLKKKVSAPTKVSAAMARTIYWGSKYRRMGLLPLLHNY